MDVVEDTTGCDHVWIPVEWEYGNYESDEIVTEFKLDNVFTVKRLKRVYCPKCKRFGRIPHIDPFAQAMSMIRKSSEPYYRAYAEEQRQKELHKQDGAG